MDGKMNIYCQSERARSKAIGKHDLVGSDFLPFDYDT